MPKKKSRSSAADRHGVTADYLAVLDAMKGTAEAGMLEHLVVSQTSKVNSKLAKILALHLYHCLPALGWKTYVDWALDPKVGIVNTLEYFIKQGFPIIDSRDPAFEAKGMVSVASILYTAHSAPVKDSKVALITCTKMSTGAGVAELGV